MMAACTTLLASDLPGVIEIAARLPLVHSLPLSANDAEWAGAARKLIADSHMPEARSQAAAAFLGSEFTVDISAKQHCLIWQGTS